MGEVTLDIPGLVADELISLEGNNITYEVGEIINLEGGMQARVIKEFEIPTDEKGEVSLDISGLVESGNISLEGNKITYEVGDVIELEGGMEARVVKAFEITTDERGQGSLDIPELIKGGMVSLEGNQLTYKVGDVITLKGGVQAEVVEEFTITTDEKGQTRLDIPDLVK